MGIEEKLDVLFFSLKTANEQLKHEKEEAEKYKKWWLESSNKAEQLEKELEKYGFQE